MEDYYEYLDSNGVTTLYKLIKDDTVALIDSYSVTINGITTTLDTHINDSDIHTPIADIENMVDTKISGLVNSAPETLDTLKELSDALGNDPNFATTVANQIGNKANKDSVYTKEETNTLLEGKANSVHNHVVSDITDFPTIPTKTSELINDSGFLTSSSGVITSVSWSDITDKPNFSTVATSGSYTDLSNTPTIPTKVSQLENDMGFGTGGDTSDCVHKTGNETIDGIKTFNDTVIQKKDGIFKNDNVDITTTPSSNFFTHLFFSDKNNIANAFIRYAQITNGINEINLFVRDKDLNNYGVAINTNNEFLPVLNNTYSLGSNDLKWAKIYSDDVVHTSGNETISGIKTFNDILKIGQGTLQVGSDAGYSVTYDWKGSIVSKQPSGTYNISLPNANGTLALDENLVHRSGNEYIGGVKFFNDLMYIYNNMSNKNSQMDLFTTPANTLYAHYMFVDKNNEVCAYMQYGQKNTGTDFIGLFIHDKNKALHGIQVTTNNEVRPIANNTYSLGSSDLKWAKVYSTNNITNMVITYAVTNHNNTSTMTVCGGPSWDTGSTLFLYGNRHSIHPGAFDLTAKNTTNESKLIGFPNGTLTWNGKNLITTEFVKGTNYWYRKHSDGFIEQGGIGYASIMEWNNQVTLPTPFSNNNYVVTGSSNFRADIVFGVASKTATYFYCGLSQPGITWATGTFSWYACGY